MSSVTWGRHIPIKHPVSGLMVPESVTGSMVPGDPLKSAPVSLDFQLPFVPFADHGTREPAGPHDLPGSPLMSFPPRARQSHRGSTSDTSTSVEDSTPPSGFRTSTQLPWLLPEWMK